MDYPGLSFATTALDTAALAATALATVHTAATQPSHTPTVVAGPRTSAAAPFAAAASTTPFAASFTTLAALATALVTAHSAAAHRTAALGATRATPSHHIHPQPLSTSSLRHGWGEERFECHRRWW